MLSSPNGAQRASWGALDLDKHITYAFSFPEHQRFILAAVTKYCLLSMLHSMSRYSFAHQRREPIQSDRSTMRAECNAKNQCSAPCCCAAHSLDQLTRDSL